MLALSLKHLYHTPAGSKTGSETRCEEELLKVKCGQKTELDYPTYRCLLRRMPTGESQGVNLSFR